jgi:4-hydroxybenzoate polyprenyltransferase
MPSILHLALTLSRASNLPTVWTNCLAAWAINQSVEKIVGQTPAWHDPTLFDWGVLGWLLLGASLVYSGGCVLNDAFDQKFDKQYNPNRPIPSGQINPSSVWVMGILFLVIGGGVLVGLSAASILWTGLLIGAVCLYDWCHKKWVGSVWIMGSCRTFLWLVAGSAGSAEIMNTVIICALCVGGYVVGISLFARNESKRGETDGYNSLSILLLFNPCLLTLGLIIMWNHLDPTRVFLLNISGLFLGWIVFNAVLRMKNSTNKESIGQGVSILLAGICSVDALAVCFFVPALIVPCYVVQFSAHILQKKFAAT